MRVLFTTPILERPAAGGPQLRIENSIKALSRACTLDLFYRAPRSHDLSSESLAYYQSLCDEVLINEFGGLSRNRYLRKAQRILAMDVDAEAGIIVDHVDRFDIRTVWFGYGNISFPLIRRVSHMRPGLSLICDTDSVWSRFILRELPLAAGLRRQRIRLSGLLKQRQERAWVDLCDVTTAVSEVDAEYYRSIARNPERIQLFSNVIDIATYQVPPPPADLRRPAIYLAGTFGHYHSPMDTAARWILEEVLPILRRTHMDLHFYIVGKDSDKQFGHLGDPRVTVTGTLPSVLPYLCNIDVALVPLHFESGTRFKILEAGACGIPLVSTTLGAEGLPAIDGQHLLIADTANEFASAIIRLLNDRQLATTLATNCRELVEKHFSIDSLAQQGRAILRHLEQK